MCGLGKTIDKNYEPSIPEIKKFEPTKDYAHGPGGACDAYMRYKDSDLIAFVRKKLEGFNSSPLMIDITQNVEEIIKQVYIQSRSYDQVIEKALEKENFIECRPGIKPISDNDYIRISDYFGWRIDPFTKKATIHHGIDFAGERGGNVYATGKGIVIKAGYSLFGYGRIVEIDHGFGYKTRYAHLDKIFVKEGDKVWRGDKIGLLGNSGRSTGPHLHYEVRINNKPVNPEYFFNNDISPEEYDKMITFYHNN